MGRIKKVKEAQDQYNLSDILVTYGNGSKREIENLASKYKLIGINEKETQENIEEFILKVENIFDINLKKMSKREKNFSKKQSKKQNNTKKNENLQREKTREPKSVVKCNRDNMQMSRVSNKCAYNRANEAKAKLNISIEEAIKQVEPEGDER